MGRKKEGRIGEEQEGELESKLDCINVRGGARESVSRKRMEIRGRERHRKGRLGRDYWRRRDA